MKQVVLTIMIIVMFVFGNDMFQSEAESVEITDTFDSIIIEDEQVPLYFASIENIKDANFCTVHWRILVILFLAFIMLLAMRKFKKAYFIELVAVAIISIILCFEGNCRFDWIFAIAGTVILEIIDIIFVEKSKEST